MMSSGFGFVLRWAHSRVRVMFTAANMHHPPHLETAIVLPTYASAIADGRAEILKELAKTSPVTHAISVALLDDRPVLWEEAFVE